MTARKGKVNVSTDPSNSSGRSVGAATKGDILFSGGAKSIQSLTPDEAAEAAIHDEEKLRTNRRSQVAAFGTVCRVSDVVYLSER